MTKCIVSGVLSHVLNTVRDVPQCGSWEAVPPPIRDGTRPQSSSSWPRTMESPTSLVSCLWLELRRRVRVSCSESKLPFSSVSLLFPSATASSRRERMSHSLLKGLKK
ncbi:hypothetical protein E2C01_058349 [Portunus trituberculatus]|uniref:Uncharacterized protein n=1 Tax=Portunus trituberculatus TaxID=210409 RepID=A0A5B7H540_PORTR|nr:hypothetical protein [Portunus trituberculatus]